MDSSTPSSRAALYQDSLTGLLTVQGWVKELLGSVFPSDGGMVAFEVAGVSGVNQTFGYAAGDVLLCEVVARARQALPSTTILMRGRGYTLFAFLPTASGMVVEAFESHLRQSVCTRGVTLPGGEQITPRLVTAVLSVKGDSPVLDAVQTLERNLVRQPEYTGEPAGIQRVVSARDEMDHRLEAVRLYGRDELIERILAELKLPGLQPETVIIVAPPQAGKTRLLGNMIRLLDGQHLPRAEVICRPSDQQVPFTLMVSMISQFLTAYPTELLQQRMGTLCSSTSPWLTGLFPVLRGFGEPPPPPKEEEQLRHGLEAVLMALVRHIPHVAVIHSIHLADPQSLAAITALQAISGHGLRIIAGADAEDEEMPTVLRRLIRQRAKVISLPSLSEEEVMGYLQEVVPTIAQPYVASRLYRETSGLLLSIEATLRAWVEDGLLTLNNGRWEFFPERVPPPRNAGLTALESQMLAQAALTGPCAVTFLAALWHLTEEQARIVVARGREFGYLRPADPGDPEIVQFLDPDEASTFAQRLSREERINTHAAIAALMDTSPAGEKDGAPRDLAYHQEQAGQNAPVEPTFEPPSAPAREEPPAQPTRGWDIPASIPITTEDMPRLLAAIQHLRLAGVKLRLYPPNSQIVQRAVREAIVSLEALLANRPSLVITFDGYNVAFDGQALARRDLQMMVKDIQTWMAEGWLQAIGFAPGVNEAELLAFLTALVLYEPTDANGKLIDQVAQLPLVNLKVLSRDQDPPSASARPVDAPGATPAVSAGRYTATPVPPATAGAARPAEAADGEGGSDAATLLANPLTVEPAMWGRLPEMVERSAAGRRRLMMSNLARWLREQESGDGSLRNCPIGLDQLLAQRLLMETDLVGLRETALAAEKRLEQLMAGGKWEEMIALLAPLRTRLAKDALPDVQRLLGGVLDRIGEGTALRGLIDETVQHPGSLDRVRRVIIQLGERALRPLITTLKDTTVMQERARLMQLLREFGDTQQPLLLEELQAPNPWYVYRNLLQVLEENGTMQALAVIAEKLHHEDPRVRAEAVSAAAHIGREQATTYLLSGLQDEDADVRARALSLVGFCATPRILEQVMRLLVPPRINKDEPESVQLAAVLALGQFTEEEAFYALAEILHPRLFSPFRRKSDEVRAGAVSALANHLSRPGAIEAVQRATRDRSMLVRQTAQRVDAQYQRDNANPSR